MNANTDLLERYLQAIRKFLPWNLSRARQQDILAELRANLESQLEERQADLGRPLTEGEMIDWIKQLGSPIHVAARYQPTQYLIGPAIFPMYLYVIRLALLWAFGVSVVVNATLLWAGAPNAGSVSEAIFSIPGILFTAAAWVTLIFAALEYIRANHPHLLPQIDNLSTEWSPSKLPPLETARVHAETGVKIGVMNVRACGKKPRTYVQAAAEVIFGWLFLAYFLLVPSHPFLMLGPGASYLLRHYALAPVWWTFYWITVAFNFGTNVWNTIDLTSGAWRSPLLLKSLFEKAGGLITIGVLLGASNHVYVLLKHPAMDAATRSAAINQLNPVLYRAWQVVFLILAVQFIWKLIQWIGDSIRK